MDKALIVLRLCLRREYEDEEEINFIFRREVYEVKY